MTSCRKFQSGAYIDKFGYQEEALCSTVKSGFDKTKFGTIFKIQRPYFTSGTNINVMINADKIDRVNNRSGTGNREITRTNFEAPPIRPRNAIDFDKLQALDIETQGAKIQLSDKTISELFKTKVPDPQDTQWLAEKARMVGVFQFQGLTPEQIERELEVNKPLGREQRKISSKQNIGQSTLTISDKLYELEQEVKDGKAESRAQQAVITAQFALVLTDTNAIAQLTRQELTNLGTALARVGVPTTHKSLDLIPRFADIDFYNANAGMVNLLFFSKVREIPNTDEYNYDRMILNFASSANGLPAMTLRSMVAALGRAQNNGVDRRYLDLHRGGIINRDQMRAAVGSIPFKFGSPDVAISPTNQ